ncbi:MAG: RadC family protein [bacterium]
MCRDNSKDHRIGHRKRLRARFLQAGHEALADYELLELLLGYCIPRKDTKLLAKTLINTFGSFSAVFDQPVEKLQEIKGSGQAVAAFLLSIKASMTEYLKERAENATFLSSPHDVAKFVRLAIGSDQRECVMVLCLNSANRLIHHEIMAKGTVDQAPVYYREILKLALLHNATAMILVHNHPSGNAAPSRDDHLTTKKLTALAAEFNIELYDHLIVCPSYAYSIKSNIRL